MAKIRYSWYNSLRNEGLFMTKLSQEQLNNLSKEELVAETLKLQDQYIDLSQKVDFLTEQIMLMNQRQFGRKTEKNSVPDGQLNLFEFFNEVESLSKPSLPEPDIESVVVKSHSRKVKGKREEDLKDLPVRIINHTLSEEELKIKFPNGYKELPNEIYKRLCVIPATFIVDELTSMYMLLLIMTEPLSKLKDPRTYFVTALPHHLLLLAA